MYNDKPYDPDFICQDDYEKLTETAPYPTTRIAIIRYANTLPDALRLRVYELAGVHSILLCRGVQGKREV